MVAVKTPRVDSSPSSRRTAALAIALVSVFGLAVGCGDDNSSSTTAPETAQSAETNAETVPEGVNEVTVYYPTEEGTLVGEKRLTKLDPLFGALATLQSAPPAEGALAPLAEGVQVLSAVPAGSIALVDMNAAFAESIPPGGSQAQTEALAPLIYTAAAVDGIDSVSITVNGKTPDIVGLAFDLTEPITPEDLPIEVTEPTP